MYKYFLYRLYPNKTQSKKMESLINTARYLYNTALQERKDAWKTHRRHLNYYDQANELKELREYFPNIAQLNFSATQDILRRLDKSFKSFFRRIKNGEKAGYPRFKGRDQFNSITFPTYGDGIKIKDGRLYIQNVGLVKVKMHRSLEGVINTVAVKRECGKWYAIFTNTVDIEPLPISNRQVGIDVGLESFAVTSDGEYIKNPRYLRESQAEIRVAQRKVARRKKGGANRRKAVKLLSKQYLKIRNQRKDFFHKITHSIAGTYGFIAVEKLKIMNMLSNHYLAFGISDASWGKFLSILSYKAEYAGREFTQVNPNGTSQICSNCEIKVPKDLSVRIHNCPNCGISLHRDYNSALNILALGRSVWGVTWENTPCVPQEAVCIKLTESSSGRMRKISQQE